MFHIRKKSRLTVKVGIQEYFLGYNDFNEERTTNDLHSVLCKAHEECNIQNKLIAQTYDGASVMSG